MPPLGGGHSEEEKVHRKFRFRPGGALPAVFAAVALFMLPAAAGAETVSSGAPQILNPSGHAKPENEVSQAKIAPRETLTPAQLRTAQAVESAGRPSGATAQAPITAAQLNFEGTGQTQSLRPPDTHGAVGATQFVEVTNSSFEVFNKTSGVKQKSVSLNSFCNYAPQTIFDPRAVYDKIWNRWIIVAEAFPESASTQILCVAVSTTSSATGSFYIYKFDAPRGAASNFYDYPMVGMDQDAVMITANIFGSSYLFSNMFAVAKADLYNGRAFSVPVFNAGASGTLAPPIVETNDRTALLVASPGGGSSIGLYKANNLGRSGASLSARTNVPVAAFAASPAAAQPGTTNKLDVLNRFQDHSTQISNHVLNVQNTGSIATPTWWQLNGASNKQAATGFFFESGSTYDFNPAIAGSPVGGTSSNPIGRMFFTWTSTLATSPGHNAAVKASGRLATDSTTVIGGSTMFTSSTFYNPSSDATERWGDYASVTLDPTSVSGCAAGNRAFVVNEKINSTTLWGSRFGRIGFC